MRSSALIAKLVVGIFAVVSGVGCHSKTFNGTIKLDQQEAGSVEVVWGFLDPGQMQEYEQLSYESFWSQKSATLGSWGARGHTAVFVPGQAEPICMDTGPESPSWQRNDALKLKQVEWIAVFRRGMGATDADPKRWRIFVPVTTEAWESNKEKPIELQIYLPKWNSAESKTQITVSPVPDKSPR